MPHTLLKRSSVYLLGSVLASAAPFLALPILTRVLGTVEFGRFGMFQLAAAALGPLLGLGLQAAITRKLLEQESSPEEQQTYLSTSIFLSLLASLIGLLLVAAFLDELAEATGLRASWTLLAFWTASSSIIVTAALSAWLAQGRAWQHAGVQAGAALLASAGSVGLAAGLGLGAEGPILAHAGAGFLAAIASLWWLWRDGLLRPSWNPAMASDALRIGVPLVPHLAAFFLLRYFDRAVVHESLGIAEVGIYVAAVQISLVVRIAFEAFNKAYVPWLYPRLDRSEHTELRQLVRGTYAHFAAAMLVAGLAFWIGPSAATFVLGSEFERSGVAVGWLVLSQCLHGAYLMVTSYVFYARKTGALSALTIATSLLNLALLILWVPRYGIEGAGAACAGANAVRFVATWWLAQRCHPMPWFSAVRGA